MEPAIAPSAGIRPPQQARSRRALANVLTAAEEVLAAEGWDDFTMTAVAARAGVSIGGIYRRFESKEQLLAAVKDRLLARLEEGVATQLAAAEPRLDSVVRAFVRAWSENLAAGDRVYSDLFRPSEAFTERGRQAFDITRRLFNDAVLPHLAEVRRPQPEKAVAMVFSVITGSLNFRAAARRMPDKDGISWYDFADELSDMAIGYLLGDQDLTQPGE